MQSRRDNDLIRELMLKLEAIDKLPGRTILLRPGMNEIAVEGYTVDQVHYHMDQLDKQRFFDAPKSDRPAFGWAFNSITPEGHDFIDTVRDPKVWRTTKERASKVGGAGLGILVEIGKSVIRGELAKLGLPVA